VSSSAIERAKPATERQIAVELEKLRSVFGYEASAWRTAAELYIDALADLPYDLLAEAVSTMIRTAGPDSRFPKPGELRGLIADRLDGRKDAAKRERNPKAEAWPDWLREIWGPEHQGPNARRAAIEKRDSDRADDYRRVDQVSALMRRHGYDRKPGWERWLDGESA
jgi:hypothetical protein